MEVMMMQSLIMTQVDDFWVDNDAILIIHDLMRINTLSPPPGGTGGTRRLCGSRARPAVDLAASPLDGLAGVVARFIPAAVFAGVGQRQRVFTPWVTFCAFLGQSLQGGASCREAVRRVQAWCLTEGRRAPDDNTAAYCQARARLPLDCLRKAHARLVEWLDSAAPAELWPGRAVKLIDGCGYSMRTPGPTVRSILARVAKSRAAASPRPGWPVFFPWPPVTWCAARALSDELPKQLAVRIVRFQVVTAGFRTKTVTLRDDPA